MGTHLSAAARIHPYTLIGPLILFFFLSHISQTLTPMQLILITESNSQCLALCQRPGLQCGKMMATVTSDCKDRPVVSTAARTPSHPSFLILSSTLHLHQTLLPRSCLWLMLFLPPHRQQLWGKKCISKGHYCWLESFVHLHVPGSARTPSELCACSLGALSSVSWSAVGGDQDLDPLGTNALWT